MQKGFVSRLMNLIASLQLLYSPHTSVGSPVTTVVFPRILEERSDSGELIVAIRFGHTLALRKASVFPERLEVATLEENRTTFHYMNGSGMERNLYHDPQAGAAVMLTQGRGLRLVGILSPTERIQPSLTAGYHPTGSIQHDVLPLEQRKSDGDISSDVLLEDNNEHANSTSSVPSNEAETRVLEARSGSSFYPLKATCETRIAVDSKYFQLFRYDKKKLVQYLAVLVAFTNLKFRTFQDNILQFQLVITGIVIFFSPRTESLIKKAKGDPSVMLSSTLAELNKYVEKEQIFRNDDAVVLLTGLDLARYYGDGYAPGKSIAGLAKIAAACGKEKVAIVEDMPRTFTSAHTMAHEIGHLVGSAHDGSTNDQLRLDGTDCPKSLKKIMAPVSGTYLVQEFSYCSTCQVAEFIMSGKGDCLKTNMTPMRTRKLTFLNVNKTRPSPDEFCKRHYTEYPGTGYINYGIDRISMENCMITCTDPRRERYVIINDAPDGMNCSETDPHAICINNKCTHVENNYVQTLRDDIKVVIK
uniref:Putative tick salivary metalloprotease n=1 Tax=Rhipicephalus pulchellus TaxID=72859 RepID=L7LTK9_RHIPC